MPQAKGFKERDSGFFQSVEVNIFSEVKSIYGDNLKVVVAEAPATTISRVADSVKYLGNKCSLDLATMSRAKNI